MKKRFLYLILPIWILILELLPYGAVCIYATPGATFRSTYSYFDPLPFGYANFAPLITAVLTCVISVLLLVYVVTGKYGWATAARYLLSLCTVISLGPLVYGIRFYSGVGGLITLCLGAESVLLYLAARKPAGSGEGS